ncbi:MAG: NADPH-dependent glutamate synthase [Candidatus Thermoplasmatota archaeon]|nr:NADPH-dependent glutamate synthase [Candidatus Thermoplasmatota archaeon]
MTFKPRLPCPEQDPKERIKNFDDVVIGYSEEMAIEEASRCLQCKNPLCVQGCPVSIDIPGFIAAIKEGDFELSYSILTDQNPIPAVCGRVCPQEVQCEAKCILGIKNDPISIGKLERFIGNWAVRNNICAREEVNKVKPPRKVAIIGSGPAGLACSMDLALAGVDVTVFEALHTFGGVLKYGIPSFRLPKDVIDAELGKVRKLGVKFVADHAIGRIFTIPMMMEEMGFDSVFIGTGAGLPKFLNLKGEELNGVQSSNEFLTRVNLMNPPGVKDCYTPIGCGKKIAVVGAGNVAMDCVRTGIRLGAERSMIVYRRAKEQAPARAEEVHHAEQEGVDFHFLSNPVEILGKDGWVTGLKLQKMELGEPDASGRRRPIPIPDSENTIECDTVIIAVGTSSNPIIGQTTPGLGLNEWGYVNVDDDQMTSVQGVFAGGDIVTGSATVILAMGAGKEAAKGILKYLGIAGMEKVCETNDR